MATSDPALPAVSGGDRPGRRFDDHPTRRADASDLAETARATKQRELDRAAEMAAEAAAQGLDGDALVDRSSVRPIRQQRPVPQRRAHGSGRVVAGQNRRSTDRGLDFVAAGPAYDPYSARRRRTPEWLVNYTAALVLGDAVVAGFVLVAVAQLGGDGWLSSSSGVAVAAAWLVALALVGAYAERHLGTGADEYRRVLMGGVAGAALLGVVLAAVPEAPLGGLVLVAVPAVTVLTMLGRNLQRRRLHRARRQGHMAKRVVIVGREVALVDLVRRLHRDTAAGWQVIGACVPDPSGAGGLGREGVHVLGGLNHVSTVLDNVRADAVIVASASETAAAYLRELAWKLEGTNIDLLVVPGLIEVAPDRLHIRPTISVPLIQVGEPDYRGMRRLVKSAIDRAVAFVVLVLLAPLFVAVAVAVKLDSRGPVFYRQRRVGKRGREFGLLKFRSMTVDADKALAVLERDDDGNGVLFKMRIDPRVTRVGRVLRRFSVDELPQLLNVLRGEMSLVGPRPALASEVAQYGDDMQRRLLVKPGVTGLWQVSGRSDLSWDESVELDVRYVENWSLGRDLTIVWRTVRAVLRGSGAY